jgi:aminoglycoside phosphotransferase (APT) family kinase protein
MPAQRLPHGYTNASWLDGERVRKQYLGEDAGARMRTELDAIKHAADRVPVPLVLDVDDRANVVTFARVSGRHGQDLVDEGQAGRVLKAAGRTLRTLQSGQSRPMPVHGDFGPQNLLLDSLTMEVVVVLDWEFAHHGDPTEDLAWAEWIVRTHHPTATTDLASLFAGYGQEPPWSARRSLMLAACQRLQMRARRLGDDHAAELWQRREALTAGWQPP